MSAMIQSGGAKSSSGSLYNVVELILDRGLVIDVFVRVSLVGIEVLTIDARVVVASVDAYLRFAEACGRLELSGSQPMGLPGLVGQLTGTPDRLATGSSNNVLKDGVSTDESEVLNRGRN